MLRLAHRSAAGSGERRGDRGRERRAGRRRSAAARAASHTAAVASSVGDEHVGAVVLDRLEHARSGDRTARAPWRTRPPISVHSRATPTASADRSSRPRSTQRAPGARRARVAGGAVEGRPAPTGGSGRGSRGTVDRHAGSRPRRRPRRRRRPRPAAGRRARRRARRRAEPWRGAVAHLDVAAERDRRRCATRRPGPGAARLASSSSAAAASTALAIDGRHERPGRDRPARAPRPRRRAPRGRSREPPCSSGTCRPSQPRSARSSQNAGSASSGASSRARAAPRASRLRRKSEAVSASARWSSVMAIDMVGATSVGRPGPRRVASGRHLHPWARAGPEVSDQSSDLPMISFMISVVPP